MERARGWRKLALATWGSPKDPQFYGELELDASALRSYVDAVRARGGVPVTVTHVVAKAVAYGLAEVPAMRSRLARGRVHPRESIDVFVIATADAEGGELTGVKICHADTKPVEEIAAELATRVSAIRNNDDQTFGRSKAMMAALPPWLLRPALRGAARLTSDLNLDLTAFGMPRQAFGSAMITSVGMWGVTKGFSPLAPYYRVPVLVLVGAVTDRPVAVDGAVVVRPMLTLTATFDHRYVDGMHAARFADAARRYLSDPGSFA